MFKSLRSLFLVLAMCFLWASSESAVAKSTDEVSAKKNAQAEKGKNAKSQKDSKTSKSSKTSSSDKSKKNLRSPKNPREVRPTVLPRNAKKAAPIAPRVSSGTALGLGKSADELNLKSNVAMVVDPQSQEVIFEKNAQVVLPVASITKLITAMVLIDAKLPMDENLEINDQDAAIYKNSRLIKGTVLTRQEALLLSLMSSENRAAYTLGRNYPGGMKAFMAAVNRKAKEIGMKNSAFVDPTGLTSKNVASAEDLAILVNAAYQYPLIRQYSTTPNYVKEINQREQLFLNSNRLVRSGDLEVLIQKTGYISEAGRCLVMMAMVQNKPYTMVFLDSVGVQSRFADAIRVKEWIESSDQHAALRKLSQSKTVIN
jgi:serine-type D-Ala-D-Ala endopeptidase (penicillin-binding protein 7)